MVNVDLANRLIGSLSITSRRLNNQIVKIHYIPSPSGTDRVILNLKALSRQKSLMDSLSEIINLGRTTSSNEPFGDLARANLKRGYEYIIVNSRRLPTIEDYKLLNQIFIKGLPTDADFPLNVGGLIKGSPPLDILGKDYPLNEVDLTTRIEDYFGWLHHHYGEQDISRVAGRTYRQLISCCPFFEGNGRTSRAILDWILYHGGYKLKEHPAELSNARKLGTDGVVKLIESNIEEI